MKARIPALKAKPEIDDAVAFRRAIVLYQDQRIEVLHGPVRHQGGKVLSGQAVREVENERLALQEPGNGCECVSRGLARKLLEPLDRDVRTRRARGAPCLTGHGLRHDHNGGLHLRRGKPLERML
jgi:hypothetical protein